MTASSVSKRSVISNLTLALLQSTGWYVVDYRYSNPYVFGKNKGCGFLIKGCKGSYE
jgi:hypothetical protein